MATTHQRTIIRKAIQARLLNRTRAGQRVLTTKVSPWRSRDLPGISVYTLRDPVDRDSRQTAPREYKRDLEVKVECALQLSDQLDDQLDAFELEVRRAIDADPTFVDAAGDPRASDCFLMLSEVVIERDAEQPMGAVVLTFEVPYYEPAPNPADVTLDDLETVDTRTSLAGDQAPADQANDHLTHLET